MRLESPIIVALDLPERERVLLLVEELKDLVTSPPLRDVVQRLAEEKRCV